MQTISIEQAFSLGNCIYIDARSPAEFEQGHIPGAVNIPLLENDERAIVGTLYKQKGQAEAKQKGLEFVSVKLSEMVRSVSSLLVKSPSSPLIVYCWRGGMRSRSVLTILELMGISGWQLSGGYKSYRRFVQDQLAGFNLNPRVIVLCGSTGAGKTDILHLLAAKQYPVIDLERLANHRGSAFGQVGLGKPETAQNFDAQLLQLLIQYNTEPFLIVECESKRVGNVYLPTVLYQAMRTGIRILAYASLPTRVNRLIAEYTSAMAPQDPEIVKSISSLGGKLGKKKVARLIHDFQTNNLTALTKTLLEDYYDPLYGYESSDPASYDFVAESENLVQAADSVASYIETLKRRS